MVSTYLLLCMGLALAATPAAHAQEDAAATKFIDDLMARMTLEEKIGQLNLQVAGDITTGSAQDTEVAGLIAEGHLGGIFNLKGVREIRALQDIAVKQSRLGIPLIVGMDVIHGYETIFPIPLAMSCSWNLEAVENAARISAREASADGISWVYSPMVDISLDARWGRVAEGNGEDPYLGSRMAEAYVRGYQGAASAQQVLDASSVMACVKHFALYGAVEAGRDYNTVDMSHLRMYNQYFPPYRAAIEAGAGSVMSSFNLVDGQHATASPWLLTDVLRRQWQFRGFVVTDYGSIGEMGAHGLGALPEASRLALAAGTDMDMCSRGFLTTLTAGEEAQIDAACRRILEAKWRLGLFEDPYRHLDPERRARDIYTDESRAAARELAAESFVLLKNRNARAEAVLPLSNSTRIALIGPLADDRKNIAGTWCVAYTPERYKTVREAIEEKIRSSQWSGCRLLYAQGCNLTDDAALQEAAEFGKTIERSDAQALREEALRVAEDADVIVCAMGECADMSGESSSRADLEMPDAQRRLLAELTCLGKPIVLLHFSGRPTVLTWEQEHVDAILNVWFGGSEAGNAIADVLFGDKAPGGRLTMTMPQATGQVPIYYNHLNTGRPVAAGAQRYQKYASNYLDVRNDPLYPFGYGLTYTTFSYSAPTLSADEMAAGDSVRVSVTIRNTGQRESTEVVQLYVHDLVASVARPVSELKGFQRIVLRPGEEREVAFDITSDMLQFLDAEGRTVLEPGRFDIMVGPNSRDVQALPLTLKNVSN